MKWNLWAIVVKGSNYRINFWFMINNQAVDRYIILICLKRLNNYEKIKKIIVVIESNTQCNMKEQQKLSTFLCLIKKYFFLAMILEMIEQFLKFSSDEIKKKFHSPKFSMSLVMAKTKKHAQQWEIRPLFIALWQISECLKTCKTNQYMPFEIKHEKSLEMYKSIRNNIRNTIDEKIWWKWWWKISEN